MKMDYYFYIHKNTIIDNHNNPNNLPIISKIEKDSLPIYIKYIDRNEAEGPFNSLYELENNSFILAEITLKKHRQRILKSSNIFEVKDYIVTGKDDTFSIEFMEGFSHITIGKISNQKVKGVHFYNPKTIHILDIVNLDIKTKVYSARIEKLNQQTGKWIKKEEITTFFPDYWTINKLFHEYNFAFKNKVKIQDRVYHSKTSEGIPVKFVIDDNDKIITLYPILDIGK